MRVHFFATLLLVAFVGMCFGESADALKLAPASQPTATSQPTTRETSSIAPPTTMPAKPLRIVYVVDASGSMMSYFGELKAELKRAIRDLPEDTKFNIILTNERTPKLLAKLLISATRIGKSQAYKFIDNAELGPGGSFDVEFNVAVKFDPAVIWILSDGDLPDAVAALKNIRISNSYHHVRINTCYFRPKLESNDQTHKSLMWTIAHEANGICIDQMGKTVDSKPLGVAKENAAPKPVSEPATPPPDPGRKSIFSE